jgi:hypothetical protein
LHDGNTVDPDALTRAFLGALAMHDPWIVALDGEDVHG